VYNSGIDLQHDRWAAYQASNVWGNYPGDNQLTGTYLLKHDQLYNSFIAEYEVFSEDDDGVGFVFGWQELNDHFVAHEINDQWPSPAADGYNGPHQKIRKREGPCLPEMNADNNVYSLLRSDDGDDGVSVNKANFEPYEQGVTVNMALKVEHFGDSYLVTFMSSRRGVQNINRRGVQKVTGHTSSYSHGKIGIFVYAHTARFDNFRITELNMDPDVITGFCNGFGECNGGLCDCDLAGAIETTMDCSRGLTTTGTVIKANGAATNSLCDLNQSLGSGESCCASATISSEWVRKFPTMQTLVAMLSLADI
jgi:hypothetical protein